MTDDPSTLMAGAAVADITPARLAGLNAMGPDFSGVHDRLSARALVLGTVHASAAIVSVDLLEVGRTVELRERISDRTGIPASAVMIVATHTHNAPRAGRTPAGGLSRAASAESIAFTERLFDELVQLVQTARTRAVPARVGAGAGAVDVNVNRDELREGVWMLGQNPDGPSDKTLRVVAVQSLQGEMVATLLGYAVHPTAALGTGVVSADIAGSAAEALSAAIGGVTLWLPGSIGDQGVRKSAQLLQGAGRTPSIDEVFDLVDSQGGAIAAEALRTVRAIGEWMPRPAIAGVERTIACPPRAGTGLPPDMRQEEVEQVDLRLTAITIGDIALLGVGGEVTTPAAAEILAATTAAHPILVSIANERLGYLADDEAFGLGTFAARGCPIQPGWVPVAAAALAEMTARAGVPA